VKVGKRQPFTLDKFDEFFRLLPKRADSERSWTVDFVARKKTAADEAAPFKKQATAKQQEANRWKVQLAELKKAKSPRKKKVADAEQQIAQLTKEARELSARAQDIEEAVYDLKAVNPNRKTEEDTRTPEELLDVIEAKGREVAEALAALRAL
jgi:type I restriction enzyme M protein